MRINTGTLVPHRDSFYLYPMVPYLLIHAVPVCLWPYFFVGTPGPVYNKMWELFSFRWVISNIKCVLNTHLLIVCTYHSEHVYKNNILCTENTVHLRWRYLRYARGQSPINVLSLSRNPVPDPGIWRQGGSGISEQLWSDLNLFGSLISITAAAWIRIPELIRR
jgi:hypothetical protein